MQSWLPVQARSTSDLELYASPGFCTTNAGTSRRRRISPPSEMASPQNDPPFIAETIPAYLVVLVVPLPLELDGQVLDAHILKREPVVNKGCSRRCKGHCHLLEEGLYVRS